MSVVVPVRDEMEHLSRTLPRLEGAVDAYEDAELIIVDNGSSDGSYEWLQETCDDDVRLYNLPGHTISAVRNFGAARAGGQILAFVDADCLVETSHLHDVVRALAESSAAAAGADYELPPDPNWIEATWYELHRGKGCEFVRALPGGNMAVQADVFRDIGGFDDNLVTGEDAELCQRIIREGYRVYHDPRVKAIHLGNADSLVGFFRKERWRALGMFGTFGGDVIDKPVMATVAHIVASGGAALGALALGLGPRATVLGVASGLLLVPAASVLYRWGQVGNVVRPLRSIVLYQCYLAARATALVDILVSHGREVRRA